MSDGMPTAGGLRRLGMASASQAVGSSTATYQLGATAKSMLQTFASTTAASGDTRVTNQRLYFNTAGASGETLRAYTIVNNVTAAVGGTVNGAHISLDVQGASGTISGAGNALRLTLGLRDTSVSGGTISALQLDSNFATGATIPTSAAAIRVTNTDVGLWAKLLNIPAPTSGGLFAAHTTQTMTQSIRIISDAGVLYYLMATDAATNRTGGA